MDILKTQVDRIQQQLSALSSTQKMLTAALVVIMALTLGWWAKYAGQPDMEPLLSQSLNDDEYTRITNLLDARGIEYQTSSDKKVLVSADRKIKVLAALGYADVLPKNTANGFDEVIKQLSPWDGSGKENMMFNRGKEITLSEVVRNFPGVADATVSIDPRYDRMIGADIEPTAFVSIRMKSGERPGKQLVNAAADVVAGAQSGLAMKNIRVVIDGVSQRVRDDQNASGGADADSVYDIRQREEDRLTRKVAGLLGDMQGVMVAVTVKVTNSVKSRHTRTVDKVESKETQISSTARETTAGAAAAPVEPAAGSNVGSNGSVAIAAGGGGGQSQTEDKSTFENFPSFTEEDSRTPAGEVTPASASVRVPRSYFIRMLKGSGAAEPTDAAVDARIQEELPRIRQTVLNCTGLSNADAVSITPYFDQTATVPPTVQASTPAMMALAWGSHSKEIVLGALALVSMFFVTSMVKKSAPAPIAVASAPRSTPAPATPGIASAEAIVGEAAASRATLDAMELDDEAVRTQQMIEQVSTLVQENPDAAASLVKRWLSPE